MPSSGHFAFAKRFVKIWDALYQKRLREPAALSPAQNAKTLARKKCRRARSLLLKPLLVRSTTALCPHCDAHARATRRPLRIAKIVKPCWIKQRRSHDERHHVDSRECRHMPTASHQAAAPREYTPCIARGRMRSRCGFRPDMLSVMLRDVIRTIFAFTTAAVPVAVAVIFACRDATPLPSSQRADAPRIQH